MASVGPCLEQQEVVVVVVVGEEVVVVVGEEGEEAEEKEQGEGEGGGVPGRPIAAGSRTTVFTANIYAWEEVARGGGPSTV